MYELSETQKKELQKRLAAIDAGNTTATPYKKSIDNIRKETSALSLAQKTELDKRMKLFETNKMDVYDWKDVYAQLKSKKGE